MRIRTSVDIRKLKQASSCALFMYTLFAWRSKLLLLSHNFSSVMINSTSLNEVHYSWCLSHISFMTRDCASSLYLTTHPLLSAWYTPLRKFHTRRKCSHNAIISLAAHSSLGSLMPLFCR
jgi:hypothetical protein